jgi:hypothetical protein
MHVSLIVPAPFDLVSGGYGYDRRIVAELREAGHQVEVVELTGAFPMVDDFARDAACAAWDRLPADTKPVIDGGRDFLARYGGIDPSSGVAGNRNQ